MKRLLEDIRWRRLRPRRTELVEQATDYIVRGNVLFETSEPRFIEMYSNLSERRLKIAMRQLAFRIQGMLSMRGAGNYTVTAELEGREIIIFATKMSLDGLRPAERQPKRPRVHTDTPR